MAKKPASLFLFITLFLAASCGAGRQSKLTFKDTYETGNALRIEKLKIEEDRKNFAIEKERVWKEINNNAKLSFESVKDIFQNKCITCHDSSFKLPFYGNILKGINPVHKHQEEGLKSLDFANGFPFSALGNPPQISLLKSIRNSVAEKSMPIKSFTIVYPKKKIDEEDQHRILAWIDPIIEKYQDYELKYNSGPKDASTLAHQVLEMKCFRCHANGNARGGFGGMENTANLIQGKYVSKGSPEDSKLYTIVRDGKMPPNNQDSLSAEEQYAIRDWLEQAAKK